VTKRRRVQLLAWIPLVLIPFAPIVAGALVGAGGAPGSTAAATRNVPAPGATNRLAPVPALAPAGSSTVAMVVRSTALRASPGGTVLGHVGPRTGFGSPDILWVVRTSGPWLGVVSPLAGNGRLGWLERAATRLSYVTFELRVALGAHSLTILRDGHLIARYRVAVGRPTAPTPTGRFAVTDKLLTDNPSGPYGCCILALSAVAPHPIENWSGGNRVAIHSTPDTASIGQSVTHGCVRVNITDGRWLLSHIPLGTPTLVSS
jgi:hypothetical protein